MDVVASNIWRAHPILAEDMRRVYCGGCCGEQYLAGPTSRRGWRASCR